MKVNKKEKEGNQGAMVMKNARQAEKEKHILRRKYRPCLGENEDRHCLLGRNDKEAGDEEKDEEKPGEEERKHFYLLIATIRRSRPLIRLPNDRVAPAL